MTPNSTGSTHATDDGADVGRLTPVLPEGAEDPDGVDIAASVSSDAGELASAVVDRHSAAAVGDDVHSRSGTTPEGERSSVLRAPGAGAIEPEAVLRATAAGAAPATEAWPAIVPSTAVPSRVAVDATRPAGPANASSPPPWELPRTVAGMATSLVAAVLAPLLATGPTPTQAPLLWVLLAFARREFESLFSPNSTPVAASVVTSPNLLVNPGAELGDPSLSGYSSVTVPGWTVTGTPTVVEYGTARRTVFPVPLGIDELLLNAPGLNLPAFLGFPGSAPTGGGGQFFGGGPVATSTLTQTVDLSSALLANEIDTTAGGLQYTLSGWLGGFFLDPSSALVTVNFLADDRSVLGTGQIGPVSALDRWFQTGLHFREVTQTIPVGTRSAQVVVTFTDRNPVLGNYNNAYADNLSFTVASTNALPATLTAPVSNVGELDHVFMVYMENHGNGDVLGSPNAPYLNQLVSTYGYGSNYYALTHPSNPNYYPVLGGSDFGFTYNCQADCFDARNLADNIEAAGKTWASYSETGAGGTGTYVPDGAHFLAFHDIYSDPARATTHLFDLAQMQSDLASASTTPDFVWFAPDDATNMEGPSDIPFGALRFLLGQLTDHQYNLAAGDRWLQETLAVIFSSEAWNTQRCAVFVTFDEDYDNLSLGVDNQGNSVPMVVIPSQAAVATGGMRPGHFVASERYDHYSLLRTIEEALGLPGAGQSPLTNNDRYARPMNEYWL